MRCYNLTTARQHLAQVTALILDGQQLEQIPPEVWQMPQLETLDLRGNAIKVLPETLGELKTLKFLLLGKNQLQQIPQSLPDLVQIDLSGNRFSHFPVALAQMNLLQKINFSSNRLHKFPNLTFPGLKELNLSGNKIATFLFSATFLPKLEKLYLSRNRLEKLEIEGVFSTLDTFDLANNQLNILPDNLMATPFLRHFYVSNNQLKQLPATLGHCNWLKTCHLAKNKFNSLPDYFMALQRLEDLDLSGNTFAKLPHLPTSIRKLNLACNQLTQIPASPVLPAALRKLDLSHNPLHNITALRKCSQLTHLGLKGLIADDLVQDLLAISDQIAIKSSSNPQWTNLLNFVRACQRKKTSLQDRSLLWEAHERKTPLSNLPLNLVLQGMNLGIPTFQQQLRKHLLEERSQPFNEVSIASITALAIIGRSTQTAQELKTRLGQKGIHLMKPDQCDFWVLGKAPYPSTLPAAQGIQWLDERDLERLLGADLPNFDATEQQNLLKLLLHQDLEYVQLALQLLSQHGVPLAVLPYLYLVWRWTKAEKLRRDLRALLERYWPAQLQGMLRSREKIGREISSEIVEKRANEILEVLQKHSGF
jgi:Leucine-rich repeat (LRR) protein